MIPRFQRTTEEPASLFSQWLKDPVPSPVVDGGFPAKRPLSRAGKVAAVVLLWFCAQIIPAYGKLGLDRADYGVWDRSGGHRASDYPMTRGQEFGIPWSKINPSRHVFKFGLPAVPDSKNPTLQEAYNFATAQNQKLWIKVSPIGGDSLPMTVAKKEEAATAQSEHSELWNSELWPKGEPTTKTLTLPGMPAWIFTEGTQSEHVPLVTDNTYFYGHYLNSNYKKYFQEMVHALAIYVRRDHPEMADNVACVRVDTGATGDESPYENANLLTNPLFNIPNGSAGTGSFTSDNNADWKGFRAWAFELYRAAFQDASVTATNGETIVFSGRPIPLIFQDIEQTGFPDEWTWVNQNVKAGFGAKYAGPVRGHHLTDSQSVTDSFKSSAVDSDIRFFSANEMDQTYTHPFFTYNGNIRLSMYWCAVEQLHPGLTIWDVSQGALEATLRESSTGAFKSAYEFFNKWAAELDPPTAGGGFCIFHEGLDASDTVKFPLTESEKGSGAVSQNLNRYMRICDTYYSQGAKIDDPIGIVMGAVKQRDLQTGFNDVGWSIVAGNYERFINQMAAENTSTGRWRLNWHKAATSKHPAQLDGGVPPLNSNPYDRFARSIDSSPARNTMYFDINDRLTPASGQPVRFSVTYLDRGTGAFEVCYDAQGNSNKTALKIVKTNTNQWITVNSEPFTDWAFRNNGPKGPTCPRGADFVIHNIDSNEVILHGVEIIKLTKVNAGTVGKGQIMSRNNVAAFSPISTDYIMQGQRLELKAVPDTGWKFAGWAGELSGTQNGPNQFPIVFPDQSSRISAIFVPVSTQPNPLFTTDPLRDPGADSHGEPTAMVGRLYSGSLAGYVTTSTSDVLSFSIASTGQGPAWLKLNPDGSFSGTPDFSSIGLNRWTIKVIGNGTSDEATLLIDVRANEQTASADLTPPILSHVPVNQSVMAANSHGAIVTYEMPTATDYGSLPTVTTSIASGSTFPLGVSTVRVRATDAAGNESVASFTVTVKANASVTLGALHYIYDGTPRAVTTTTVPTGLPVQITYGASDTAPTAEGSYQVVAKINDPMYSGSTRGTLVIGARPTQVISFSNPGPKTFGAAPIALSATSNRGLPVTCTVVSGPATLKGNTLTLTGAGTITIRADQPGNATYSAATPVTVSFTVAKAKTTLTLGGLQSTYEGVPQKVRTTTVPGGLPVQITYSGSPTPPTAVGIYQVLATITHPDYTGQASGTLVIGFPTALVGNFEGLFVDPIEGSLPLAKLQLTVNSMGAFSGKLTQGTPAGTPILGKLTLDSSGTYASLTSLTLGKGSGDYVLRNLSVSTTTATALTASLRKGSNATTFAILTDGVRLAEYTGTGTSLAPWRGQYTAAFSVNTNLDPAARPTPSGTGYATGKIGPDGVLTLAGKLADGNAFSTACASDSEGGYRIFSQPYGSPNHYLGGWIQLTKWATHPTERYRVPSDGHALYWNKPANAASPNYRSGFGPLLLNVEMATYLPPSKTHNLIDQLDLTSTQATALNLTVSNAGLTARQTTELQAVVKLSQTNTLEFATPSKAALWPSLHLTPETGLLAGWIKIYDTPSLYRTAFWAGVALQLPANSAGTVARGYVVVPAKPGGNGSFPVSGAVTLSAP